MKDRIPLTEKRLLTIEEFQQYSGIGRNNAFKLVHNRGLGVHNGRRLLVDRVAFDLWVDEQTVKLEVN